MCLKFMPYIPAIAVRTASTAAQGRELAGDHTDPLRFQKAAGLKDRGQDKKEAVDHGLHAVDMVRDVVEIWCHFGADAGKVAANELSTSSASAERALEPREFGPSVRRFAPPLLSEEIVQRPSLHRQDVVLDHFEDGQILVDHSVQDRVQHVVDTLAEERRRSPSCFLSLPQRSGIAVPHGDEVIVTGEDRHLAVADRSPTSSAVWATTYNSSL